MLSWSDMPTEFLKLNFRQPYVNLGIS